MKQKDFLLLLTSRCQVVFTSNNYTYYTVFPFELLPSNYVRHLPVSNMPGRHREPLTHVCGQSVMYLMLSSIIAAHIKKPCLSTSNQPVIFRLFNRSQHALSSARSCVGITIRALSIFFCECHMTH